MSGRDAARFEPIWPDVLGAITGGTRISMDALQFALGIFPRRAYLNQPVEAVLLLQNMVDQKMEIKVALQLPTSDSDGNAVVISTPKKMVTQLMEPGEVGVLRMPMIPYPPTHSGYELPVRMAVRYRTPKPGRAVRPAAGGLPPSVLSISSFKLQALREVEFVAHPWNESPEIITAYFELEPKRLPIPKQEFQPRYETLWTHQEMVEERHILQAKVPEARKIATNLTRNVVYPALLPSVERHFTNGGLPLHPGELKAITKMMTYTLDEGLENEEGFTVEGSRWFQALCRIMALDERVATMEPGDIVIRHLFEPAIYDAVMLGFSSVQSRVDENLGNQNERVSYANRVINWLGGQTEADLSFVYLPLAMGGVVVNRLALVKDENPWEMLRELREAMRGRIRLAARETMPIFDLLEMLITKAEEDLRRSKIPQK